MKVKVSVIVLVYNADKYLPKCLETIINQSLKEIEIICINDGSSDNSLNILNEFKLYDSRIKIISHPNRGISYSAQRGLEEAVGEYVYYVANDDFLIQDGLEVIYNSANKLDLDILTFDSLSIYENDENITCSHFRSHLPNSKVYCGLDFFEILFNNKSFLAPEYYYLFRRKFLIEKNIHFYEKVKYHEDVVFVPRAILLSKRMAYISTAPYVYRIRSGSIKHSSYNIERLYDYFYLTECLTNYLNNYSEIIRKNENTYSYFIKYIKDHYSVIISKMLKLKPIIPSNIICGQLLTLKESTHIFSKLQLLMLIIFFKFYKIFYKIIYLKRNKPYTKQRKLILK